MRIGTWNVEYADVAATNARRLAAMRRNPADIWVLTETHDDLRPPEAMHVVHSLPRPPYGNRVKSGSRWVSIWSRYPCEQIDGALSDPERTVVAQIETPLGSMLVYGTVMPWCGDKGRMGERKDASGWSEFYRVVPDQIREWKALCEKYPGPPLIVAGDFNVDMATGGYYGSRRAIDMVQSGLNSCELVCATKPGQPEPISLQYPPIDHIAVPAAWRARIVAAWEGRDQKLRMSDHSGLVVQCSDISLHAVSTNPVAEPSVTLRPAKAEDRPLLEGLLQFYIYDFSEFARNPADFRFNASGAFEPYPYLDQYFSEPNCWPLLIYADDAVAGFALINQHSHLTGGHIERNMGEFFVGRPFRRNGVATAAFHRIVALHPGEWEVAVALKNAPARSFWPRAIASSSNVSDVEQVDGDGEHWTGPIWTFRAA